MEQVLNKLYFTEFYDKKDNLDINISCIEKKINMIFINIVQINHQCVAIK